MVELRIESDEDAAAAPVRWIAAIRNAMNPTTLVALLLASILIFLVANPLFQLVKDSFTKASDHSFTLANYVTAFGRPRYVQALINSMELGAVAAAIVDEEEIDVVTVDGNGAESLDVETSLFVVAGDDKGQARQAGAL